MWRSLPTGSTSIWSPARGKRSLEPRWSWRGDTGASTWRADAVAVPLSARLRRFELQHAFADAQPAAVVSVAEHGGYPLAKEIQALAESTPSLRKRIVVGELGEVSSEMGVDVAEPAPP